VGNIGIFLVGGELSPRYGENFGGLELLAMPRAECRSGIRMRLRTIGAWRDGSGGGAFLFATLLGEFRENAGEFLPSGNAGLCFAITIASSCLGELEANCESFKDYFFSLQKGLTH
jgi:hypothetical protein